MKFGKSTWFKNIMSTMLVMALGLQLLTPTAQALQPVIGAPILHSLSVPATESYVNIPNVADSIKLSYFLDPNGVGPFLIPVVEQIQDDKGNLVYDFSSTYTTTTRSTKGTYTRTWDGTFNIKNYPRNGSKVASGNYKFYVSATKSGYTPVSDSAAFHVTSVKTPVLTLNSPGSNFTLSLGQSLTIPYKLDLGTATSTHTTFYITDKNLDEFIAGEKNEVGSGDNSFSWDGKKDGQNVALGNYPYRIVTKTVTPYVVSSNNLFGTISVSNVQVPAATISNLSISPNPYNPKTQGLASVKFDVNDYVSDASINVEIFQKLTNVLGKKWFYPIQQKNNVLTWDGISTVTNTYAPNGTYVVKVWGGSGGKDIAIQTIEFTLTDSNPPAPNDLPIISNLQVSPNPYDPGKGVIPTLSYDINNLNATLNLSILDQNGALVNQWSNIAPVKTGANAVLWNAASNLKDGAYVFKVSGFSDNKQLVGQQITFWVQKAIDPANTCAGFNDVSASDPDCAGLTFAKSRGIITGNADGTANLSGFLQRDQVAKIAMEAYGMYDKNQNYCSGQMPYYDMSSAEWSYQYVCDAKNRGIVTGYKSGVDFGNFRPARVVNRSEFLAIMIRPLTSLINGFTIPDNNIASYTDVELGQWYAGLARLSMSYNLFTGSYFQPLNAVTRREAVQVIYKLHNSLAKP